MSLHTIESLLDDNARSDVPTVVKRQRHGSDTCRRIYGIDQLDAPAILMFTSGSTGDAKAVRITHKQVLAAIARKASVRQLPLNRSFLNWIGLDHIASLVEIHF